MRLMVIDHVILATADLEAAAARLEAEHGLVAAGGGRHEGVGTHNRVIPLGGGYLEVMAVADPDEAAASPLGRILAAAIARRAERLLAWCVAVPDVDAVAARLGTDLHAIARQGLTARLTAVGEAMAEPLLPFFIERDPGVADPGARGQHGGITWVEVAGDDGRLRDWLGGEDLPVRVVAGEPELRAVGIGGRELR
jgi:Glyoxalase-like domain